MNLTDINTNDNKSPEASNDKSKTIFKICKDRYCWYLLILFVIFIMLVYSPLINTGSDLDLRNGSVYQIALYRTIFIIIAALVTWKYSMKAGIITCLFLAAAIFVSYVFNLQKGTSIFLEIGLLALGIIFCLLIGKILNYQKLLHEKSERLKMQALVLKEEIAERRKAGNEVRTSEKKYRLLAENISDIIWVVDFDSPETPSYISPSVNNLLGYSVEEAMQKKIDDITTTDSYIKTIEMLNKMLNNTKEQKNIKSHNIELELKHKNGQVIPVDVSFNLLKQPQEKPAGIMIIARDISERKQTEEKILRIAEEWQITFDSISSMISIHDKNYRIIRVNKTFADYFNAKPEKFIGKYCYEVMHNLCEPIEQCPHRITIETKKSASTELYRTEDEKYFHISTSPIFDKNGELSGSVHIAADITERKQMEQQLIMSDRLASIGELVSGVAHELNNPLTSILGFSQLIMENSAPTEIKEPLDIIYKESQRAAEIVKNLLTFARKHPPVKQLEKINSAIDEVLKLRAYEHHVNNISVKTSYDKNLPDILIDRFQLQQVFLNIIINAENAMLTAHNKGILSISTEKKGNNILIKFKDDGTGISKKDMPHIFSPFFTTKKAGKGTGLGLSICNGIIKEHNGKIYAESEYGKGTTFILELPLIKND
jgi:PAS domain S-box-containing protein